MLDLPLNWIELAGYVASALVLVTFWMQTLLSLRVMAILSNVVFIVFALGAGLMPVLVLHAALLPLNLYRIRQHVNAYRRVRATAEAQAEVEALMPFMRPKDLPAGAVLFLKGDRADRIYYISKGAVDLPELGKTLGPGNLLGEVGLFTPDRTRTGSAVCAEDCELLVMSDGDIVHHCIADPSFGLFLTKLIAGRMAENQRNVTGFFK